MQFYVGAQPHQGWPLSLRGQKVCISANSLRDRAGRVAFVGQSDGWLLDSGAFTQLNTHGGFVQSPEDYAAMITRYGEFEGSGLAAAVSQDFMCEPFVLERFGRTVADHQRMTIERYDQIRAAGTGRTHLMPVLQGWEPSDYLRHLDAYGERLTPGMWVGVGSVCKRQGNPRAIAYILQQILQHRSDLRLHGFGVKKTALKSASVRDMLHSADSMAWSFAARREGRDQNDWFEALQFAHQVTRKVPSDPLPLFA